MPVADFSVGPVLALAGIAAGLMVTGLLAFRHRDILIA
jgi:putative exporter of polyketide antibiotics